MIKRKGITNFEKLSLFLGVFLFKNAILFLAKKIPFLRGYLLFSQDYDGLKGKLKITTFNQWIHGVVLLLQMTFLGFKLYSGDYGSIYINVFWVWFELNLVLLQQHTKWRIKKILVRRYC